MRLLLAIDAATYQGSAALLGDGDVLAECDAEMRGVEEERLMLAVDAVFRTASITPHQLSGIVCSGGPGNFTSLRIAASIAKGMATALAVPLFSVPSLALLAAGVESAAPRRVVATLDALRGERYLAAVDRTADGEVVAIGAVRRVVSADVERAAADLGGALVGPDHAPPSRPRARSVLRTLALVTEVDLALWEPAYGRQAEAQVKWEAAHGRPLSVGEVAP